MIDVKQVEPLTAYDKAISEFKSENYARAIELLDLEQASDDQEKALFCDLKAQCHLKLVQEPEAIKCFLQGLSFDGECVSLLHNYGLFLLEEAKKGLTTNSFPISRNESLIHLLAANKLEPNNPQILHSIASYYQHYGKFIETHFHYMGTERLIMQYNNAIKHYLAAMLNCTDDVLKAVIRGNFCEFCAEFGHFFYKREDYLRASVQYKNALILDSRHIPARNQLAMCQVKQNRYVQAREIFAKILEYTENDEERSDAWLNIACCYRHENQFPKAKDALRKAKQLNPMDNGEYIAKEEDALREAIRQQRPSLRSMNVLVTNQGQGQPSKTEDKAETLDSPKCC